MIRWSVTVTKTIFIVGFSSRFISVISKYIHNIDQVIISLAYCLHTLIFKLVFWLQRQGF